MLTIDSTLETSMEDFKEWLFPSYIYFLLFAKTAVPKTCKNELDFNAKCRQKLSSLKS